jgi:KDO2-lipid IV(A) lauroyltransferase
MRKFFKKIQYIIEYVLLIIIIKLLRLVNIDQSADFCSYIARKIGPLLPITKVAIENLQYAFGSNVNHKQIIDELWDNFGRYIGEFPYVNLLSKQEIEKRINIIGLEHLVRFQEQKQPFLLFTGHFANWDLALKVICQLYPKFGIVYRMANNPYVNGLINNFRSSDNIHLIAKGSHGVINLIRAFKSKQSIAMLVDQKMNDGIQVPFFNRPSMTSHAIAKFALRYQYPIVPCQIIRTKGSYLTIIIHPSLHMAQTKDNNVDCYNIMLQINQMIEVWVRQNPAQWFWFHNRWGKKIHEK